MNKSERIPFHVEMNQIIELLARQIYQSPLALLRENCQNAYDAILQRKHLGQSFEPDISISISDKEISITDNGIGMTREDLVNHYWRAGSSGKNNPEARAAGVVGTFGIGAMANFGIASTLTVVTESAKDGQRTRCYAERDTLSATEDCIEMIEEAPLGSCGTTVTAQIQPHSTVNIDEASNYIREFVRFLDIPVMVNGELVSKEEFETAVVKPPSDMAKSVADIQLNSLLRADFELAIAKTGEVWIGLKNIRYSDMLITGEIFLRQGMHQISTFRSRFALAKAGISSIYGFGGIANLSVLEPTAGREAVTTDSLQLLQTIVTECDTYTSERIAETELSNLSTSFMQWATQHGRYDLCSNLSIRLEPENQSIRLGLLRERTQQTPINYFEGSNQSLIAQYATEEQPLVVVSTSQPRRKCELAYLRAYCNAKLVENVPQVRDRKPKLDWTMSESAFAFRVMSILQSDYFVETDVQYGKISHDLPLLIDNESRPINIVLDNTGATVAMMLKMYDEDFSSLSGVAKDFVRNMIFPKISNLVPSSTRQGAEAFLRAIRRPREVFEYEKSDLGSLSEIWQDYLDGKLTMTAAARQSTTVVSTNVQFVDRAATTKVSDVIPDVLDNERMMEQVTREGILEEPEALPAITRLEVTSTAKLLIIDENENPLKGYRCFLALTDRVREDRGEFFLQPHRTEIVWGGQKAFYIFQHHSGEFGLYYDLLGNELLSDTPGGKAFLTCTIVLRNQIYIPVPDEIRSKFIPSEVERKRFEIRCELLYPEISTPRAKTNNVAAISSID